MNRILLLEDIRNRLWDNYEDWNTDPVSLKYDLIHKVLSDAGFFVEKASCSSFDFSRDYSTYYIVYTSAEDYCGGSKSYIEDILLFLRLQGATLIPDFEYFKAHDNKVMMEILRSRFENEELKSISSRVWPNLEELIKANSLVYPIIIKESAGAGGGGVYLANNREELIKYAEIASRMIDRGLFRYLSLVNIKQKIFSKKPVPIHNNKFVTQNYIKGLDGDYKVLIFSTHYFVLHRLNRQKDFRASGSGKFTNPNENEINCVLDFARKCKNEIHSPCISLDICFDGNKCHLIEFQCVSFGLKAMSLSEYHYELSNKSWKRIDGRVVPEEEFAKSIIDFITNKD